MTAVGRGHAGDPAGRSAVPPDPDRRDPDPALRAAPFEAAVQYDLVRGLSLQIPVATFAQTCVVAYVMWVVWNDAPRARVLAWGAAFQVFAALELWTYWRYRREGPDRLDRTGHWARLARAVILSSGALWGIAPLALMGPDSSFTVALAMLLGMCTLVGGSVPMMLYQRRSMAAYHLLILVPLALRLAGGQEPRTRVLALATASFAVAMLFFGRVQGRLMEEYIRARHENADLVRQLRLERDAADRANRAKSQFFAAASHDLRQPLHALGLFSAALRDVEQESERQLIVDRVQASVQALESLFDELLDISRLDAGVVTPRPVDFALESLLDALRLQFAGPASEKGLALRIVPTRALARSDPLLVSRILANLLANAVRHTQRGAVLVGVRRRGAGVCVEVRDSGPGIPADQHERIFEEFYQLANPERDRRQGLGLGLATVRRLVTLLGCRLDLDSVVGQGTVFRLHLPPGEARGVVAPAPAVVVPTDRLRGRRILVVDDEITIREGMQHLLRRWGCRVVAAASGADALARLDADAAFDLIICDYRLAGQETGADVIAAVRARVGAHLPAILVTGDTAPERLREAQATGHLLQHKPVRPAQLRAACNHLLAPDGRAH